jgi:hypothetical protein
MEYKTINNIDCYGKCRIGNAVEVITGVDTFLVDNADFNNWKSFVEWLVKEYPQDEIMELVADN